LRDAPGDVPEDAPRKQIPALLNQIDKDWIFGRNVEGVAEFKVRMDRGFDIACALGGDHRLQQRAHLSDCGIGDLRCPQARRLCLKEGANTVDISQSIEIELGNAHAAMALLDENPSRQELKNGFADRR
jgi:hypothetical protein